MSAQKDPENVHSNLGVTKKQLSHKNLVWPLILLILLAVFVGGIVFVRNQQKPAIEVNGIQISKEFFNHRVEIQENFYKSVSPDEGRLKSVKKDEVDAIINGILIESELASRSITVSDQEVSDFTNKTRDSYEKNATDEAHLAFDEAIKVKYLMNSQDKFYVDKRELLNQKINEIQPKKHFLGIWLKRPGPGDGPKREQDKAADEVVLKRAQELGQRAKSEDFSKLVSEFSEDSISKPKGGDLGLYPQEFKKGEIPASTFASMAVVEMAYKKMSKGDVEVFEYPTGYAILKLADSQGDWPYDNVAGFLKIAREKAKVSINVKF